MDIDEIRETLRAALVRQLQETPSDVDQETLRGLIERELDRLHGQGAELLTAEERGRIAWDVFDQVFGFGPLDALMRDPDVTEIMVNGPSRVFVERHGRKGLSDVHFSSMQELRQVIARMLMLAPGKRLDALSPIVDVALPDGSRINIVIPPVVAGSPHVTIRRYSRAMRSLDDYVRVGSMDERMAQFLDACVKARLNVLFSGAAGSGKTMLLEVLSTRMGVDERIIVIEDTLELHLRQPDVVRLLARGPNIEGRGEVTMADLFKATLRMRPTRILLGEIRGREVLEYLHAITSGHRGAMAIIHASTPEEAVTRLQNLVPYTGLDVPAPIVRKQIAEGLDIVVQLTQLADGTRKVTRISEIPGLDARGDVLLRDIFRYDVDGTLANGHVRGRFVACGNVPTFFDELELAGAPIDRRVFTDNIEHTRLVPHPPVADT